MHTRSHEPNSTCLKQKSAHDFWYTLQFICKNVCTFEYSYFQIRMVVLCVDWLTCCLYVHLWPRLTDSLAHHRRTLHARISLRGCCIDNVHGMVLGIYYFQRLFAFSTGVKVVKANRISPFFSSSPPHSVLCHLLSSRSFRSFSWRFHCQVT